MVAAAACGGDGAATSTAGAEATQAPAAAAGCADVVAVDVERGGDGTLTFAVTVASADTGNQKYADAWEVRTLDGEVVGTRVLAHPHVDEQPFTRSLSGVSVPDGVAEVVVAARDSVAGFCGAALTVSLPAAG